MLETKFHPFETAALADQDRRRALLEAGRFTGHAALFDTPDDDGDVIAPGAFAAALARGAGPVKLLWQHDPRAPLGVWERLREDGRGLAVSGRLILETRKGRDAAHLLAAGALDGLSIGYRVRAAEEVSGPHGPVRRLTEIALWEISLVTFPMQPAARVDPTPEPAPTDILSPAAPRTALDAVAAARARLRRA